MTGDTRMVLMTGGGSQLLGRRVLHHGGRAAVGETVVHDAVLRVVGFTLVHSDLGALAAEGQSPDLRASATRRLGAWLRTERRLIEAVSGEALQRACFVRLDGEERVREILHDSDE